MKHKYLVLPLILVLLLPIGITQAPEPDFTISEILAPSFVTVGEVFEVRIVVFIDESDPDSVDFKASPISDYQNPIQILDLRYDRYKPGTLNISLQARACWPRNDTIYRVEITGSKDDHTNTIPAFFVIDVLPTSPIETVTTTVGNVTVTRAITFQTVSTVYHTVSELPVLKFEWILVILVVGSLIGFIYSRRIHKTETIECPRCGHRRAKILLNNPEFKCMKCCGCGRLFTYDL